MSWIQWGDQAVKKMYKNPRTSLSLSLSSETSAAAELQHSDGCGGGTEPQLHIST